MLQLSHLTRILVCTHPVDCRKGIDGLAAVCRNKLNENPLEGAFFVFCNKKRSSIRILAYDGQGFWLCTKRLSTGKFQWWPDLKEGTRHINSRELQTLIWNGNPTLAKFSNDWINVAL